MTKTKVEKFKHWLYELDEQELCAGREKIMEFVKSLEKSNQTEEKLPDKCGTCPLDDGHGNVWDCPDCHGTGYKSTKTDGHKRPSFFSRLFSKINKTSTCWEWTACKNPDGYGRIRTEGGMKQAHREVYELLVGKIPKDLQIDHLCRNRGCVNPDHLEVVTRKENLLRGEGACAKNARKTHCKRGHMLKEPNLVKEKDGYRRCEICKVKVARQLRHARKLKSIN